MGRQRKYKSEEEVIQARRDACTRYYASNRDTVLSRRQERRRRLKRGTSPSSREDSPTVFIEELLTLFDSSKCYKCRVPKRLTADLRNGRRCAPLPSRVEESYEHWKLILARSSRGLEVSEFLKLVYDDLMAPPFRGLLKLHEYSLLEVALELTESMIDDTIRHAIDCDPDGRSRFCQIARELRDLVEGLTLPLRELIESHRYGDMKVLAAVAAKAFRCDNV